jgi:hypothetical protein
MASGCAVVDLSGGLITVSDEVTPIMLGRAATANPLKDSSGS